MRIKRLLAQLSSDYKIMSQLDQLHYVTIDKFNVYNADASLSLEHSIFHNFDKTSYSTRVIRMHCKGTHPEQENSKANVYEHFHEITSLIVQFSFFKLTTYAMWY